MILLPPTALMGATLPAVARRYQGSHTGSSALAELYGANTVGAVLGCLWTGFYILPNWDIWVASGIAAAIILAIGLTALRLSRRAEEDTYAPSANDARVTTTTSAPSTK
jgi:spermidine synthase